MELARLLERGDVDIELPELACQVRELAGVVVVRPLAVNPAERDLQEITSALVESERVREREREVATHEVGLHLSMLCEVMREVVLVRPQAHELSLLRKLADDVRIVGVFRPCGRLKRRVLPLRDPDPSARDRPTPHAPRIDRVVLHLARVPPSKVERQATTHASTDERGLGPTGGPVIDRCDPLASELLGPDAERRLCVVDEGHRERVRPGAREARPRDNVSKCTVESVQVLGLGVRLKGEEGSQN